MHRIITFAGLALIALLTAAAPAHAAFTVDAMSAAPSDTRAGANSDFTIGFRFGGGEQVKDLTLDLPPGVVGNPTAAARCSEVVFSGDGCPAESVLGTTTTEATVLLAPTSIGGTIYNLEPRPGEPARLGIVLRPAGSTGLGKIFLQSPVSARTSPDIGLRSTLRDIPRESGGLPVTVNAITMTLNGAAANGPFMRNPTGCDAATTRLSAASYDGTVATGSAAFTPTACDTIAFAPRLGVIGGGRGNTARRAHPGLTTTLVQEATEGAAKTVTVKLPPLLAPDLTVVQLCEPEQVVAQTCPVQSRVGEAQAFTPLLPTPLSGPVHLTRNPTGLPTLSVDLRGLLAVQLTGTVTLDGGIATTFDGLPDVPLTRFVLRFSGGRGGLLQTSEDMCEAKDLDVTGRFRSYSGVARQVTTRLGVEGCRPVLEASARALRTSPVVAVKVSRPALGEKLRSVTLTLPAGMKFDRRRVARGLTITAGARPLRMDVTARGRRLVIPELPDGGVDSVRITMRAGAVVASAPLRRRVTRRLAWLDFTARVVDAAGTRSAIHDVIAGR